MRDYEAVLKQARTCENRKYCDIGTNCEYYDAGVCCQGGEKDILNDAADAIEELLAKVPTAERLAEILSRYFQIGDSYTFELTRVKEAFSIGTMSFDDFSEWDDENVSDLAEYIMESLSEPPKGVE